MTHLAQARPADGARKVIAEACPSCHQAGFMSAGWRSGAGYAGGRFGEDGGGMATAVQVTFDCADPHRMAQFWASALGYEKEDHTAFVKQLLDSGSITRQETIDVDGGRQFADVSACRDREDRGPRIFFQKVPEGKAVKNRVHLDLHLGKDRYEAEVARLEAIGAHKLWFSDDRGSACWTMSDIEDNEFCVH
jgi:Glyoxalase-like domain